MEFFQCNKPASEWKSFVLKVSRLVDSRSATPGWRKMTTVWWYTRKQKLTDNQQLLVVWRRQKVRSTSAAKINRCTDVIGFWAVLPNWTIAIKEVRSCQPSCQESFTPALLGKKPPWTGAHHLLYRPHYIPQGTAPLSFTQTSVKATKAHYWVFLAFKSFVFEYYNKNLIECELTQLHRFQSFHSKNTK